MQYHIPKKVFTFGKRLKKEKSAELGLTPTNYSESGSKSMFELERTSTGATKIWIFTLRGKKDDLPQ